MHEPVGLEAFEAASLLAKNDLTLTYVYVYMYATSAFYINIFALIIIIQCLFRGRGVSCKTSSKASFPLGTVPPAARMISRNLTKMFSVIH